MLKSTISRVAVSAFAVIVLCHVAKAEPVGTVLGGTIIASNQINQAISGTLQVIDQNGNPLLIQFASQGTMLTFIGSPGTPVVFQAVIAGNADTGNVPVAINVIFSGTGPVIPNTNAPTLDLIGSGTIQFSGFVCTGPCISNPTPLFSFSGSFSGPVDLHFTSLDFNGETRYQLRTATATLSDSTVPEPVSMLLFGTGLAASSLVIRRKYGRRH
jgi:PEP-CTERM motif-containing protein